MLGKDNVYIIPYHIYEHLVSAKMSNKSLVGSLFAKILKSVWYHMEAKIVKAESVNKHEYNRLPPPMSLIKHRTVCS
jgi:hypothetical protein